VRNKEDKAMKEKYLGWVNCALFDYKHELRSGLMSLNLWPDEKANPIGTCVANHQGNAATLYIEFDAYALPVVFPNSPPKRNTPNRSLFF
jgi:hypothetical protein